MAQSSPIVNLSQYFGARFTAMMLGLFPVNANLRSARAVGSMLYAIDRKHRRRALENLRASFPEQSEKLSPVSAAVPASASPGAGSTLS